MKTFRYILGAIAVVCVFASCDDENYMRYDTAHSGIYFTGDTVRYSFGVTPIDIREHTIKVPVAIMGALSGSDRTFSYELVTADCVGEEGKQYVMGTPVVHADSTSGYIPITVLRDGLKGNYQDGYERYKLTLRLTASDTFVPTLDSASQVRVVMFDNAVEQPEWYNAMGEKVWSLSTLGKWHPYKFIKMVEYFHALENTLPETYKKMVALYGENLEHIEYGDPYQYRTVFKKYIYLPMYEHFNDPANEQMILAEYPDFPFDFPYPF